MAYENEKKTGYAPDIILVINTIVPIHYKQ